MKRLLLIFFFIGFSEQLFSDQDVDAVKGIGTSFWSMIKTVPEGFVSFWKNIKLLGAAPDGYYYQYFIINDTAQPVWVATQQMRSVMGGVFPQADGWNCQKVSGYSVFPTSASVTITSAKASSKGGASKNTGVITNCAKQDYYFEMFIKTTDKTYSNHMPYLEHDDTLYQLDKLDVSPDDKNSTNCSVYRIYMGKDLNQGEYVHSVKAEIVGSISTSSTLYKDAISMDTQVTDITIKNSTDTDYYVGFSPASSDLKSATQVPASKSVFLGLVKKNSFGLLRAVGSVKSFQPGVISVYESNTATSPITSILVPKYSFSSLPYTLEIYKDTGQTKVTCDWQGIMSGHYDMPSGRIKDITPIIGTFWYQSAAQAATANQSSGYDLPGSVWIVSYEKNAKKTKILGTVMPGNLLYFQIERPEIEDIKEIYFFYLNSNDVTKVNLFINNFFSGTIDPSITNVYENSLDTLMSNLSVDKTSKKVQKNAAKTDTNVATIVNQIALNSMQMNRGEIKDTTSGITGYLLGMDVFMPVGMGADPCYYVLTPSISAFSAQDIAKNSQLLLPTSSVQNYMTSAPKGLPTAAVANTYAPTTYAIA